MKRALCVALAAMMPVMAARGQETITFDDVTTPTSLGVGYHGLDWRRFYVVNGSSMGAGYANAAVSGDNVTFGPGEEFVSTISSGSLFTFNSAWITSAFKDGATMTVKGYTVPAGYPPPEDLTPFAPGAESFFSQFIINSESPLFVAFDWTDVYRVTFTSMGGVTAQPGGDPGGDGYFAVDDIAVNYGVAPEPSTLLLTASAFAAVVGIGRRRRTSRP